MKNALRVATLALPVAFTLACADDLTDVNRVWDVTLEPIEGDCAVPPWFGNRWWSEVKEEDVPDPDDPESVAGQKLRFTPQLANAGTEMDFIDCPIDGREFACDPAGETLGDGGILHMTLTGTRDSDEHLLGTVDAVGTTGDELLTPDATTSAITCEGTWSFDATQIVDRRVRPAVVDDSCDLEGTVSSAPAVEPARLIVTNNTSTRVEVGAIDASGGESNVGTAEAAGQTEFETAIGTWFRLWDLDDPTRCLGMVEVTEVYTTTIVHGRQD